VRIGQKVRAGERIGAIGSTGNSTGPHLHFEVIKNGQTKNPLNYI
jgi:murein DD-endopeptidase MepM/ murein hydrolase activator NlpD